MKSKAILAFVTVLLIGASSSSAVSGLSIDRVDGAIDANSVAVGTPITFQFRMTNDGANIVGSTNGFRIYSPSGATWDTAFGTMTGAITTGMMDQFFINEFSIDGAGADTIGFGGFSIFAPGIPTGFDTIPFSLTIGPIDPSFHGQQICIDSAFYRPSGVWLWSTSAGPVTPSWDGPHCYTITDTTVGGGSGAFSLDHVDGLSGPNTLATGVPVTFHIRMSNQTGSAISGLTNGFRIFSPTGAQWGSTSGDTTGAITSGMMDNFFVNGFSLDGMGADTVGFGGFRIFTPGIPDGFDAVTYRVHIGPISSVYGGGQICLDSAFYPPASIWKWSTTGGDHYPSWDGPHCFDIEGSQPEPRIVAIQPDSAFQGQSLSVTITGSNTRFTQASWTFLRRNAETIYPSSLAAINDTVMTAFYNIPNSATTGQWDVSLGDGMGGSLTLAGAFTILASGQAQIVSVDPDSAYQGQMLNVYITGQNTSFLQASWTTVRLSTNSPFPQTIIGYNVLRLSNTVLRASFNIPQSATTGLWDVSVEQEFMATLTLPAGFRILSTSPAQIISVIPNSAQLGQSLWVTITGQNTHFGMSSNTTVRLTDQFGFSNIWAGNILVINSTTMNAYFTIHDSAATGPYSLTVFDQGFDSVSLSPAFWVNPAQQLVSINPDSAYQGESLSVTITGRNTRFLQASWTFLRRDFQTIGPSSFAAINDTVMTAFYHIPISAATGQWDVGVWDGMGGTLTLPGAFSVLPAGQPLILSVNPDSAYQGQSLTVNITGLHTMFQQASMVSVRLSDSMYSTILATSVTVIHDELLAANFTIPNSASTGYRDVTVNQSGYPAVTKYGAFRILPQMGISDITLDHVDGMVSPGVLAVNQPIRFHMRLNNTTIDSIFGSTNGFRISSNSGAQWGSTSGQWTPAVTDNMYDQKFVNLFSADGMGADTIGLGGFRLFGTGISPFFNDIAWTIDIGPISQASAGGQICIDSAFYPPAGLWLWSLGANKISYTPTWDGPHCFSIDSLSGNPPQIVVQPDSFFVSQAPNDSTMRTLTIGNIGGGSLDYQLNIIFAEPAGPDGIEADRDIVDAQKEAQDLSGTDNTLSVWEANGVAEASYQQQYSTLPASDVATDRALSISLSDPGDKTNMMIEDFDTSLAWPWSPWVSTGFTEGTTTLGCAHNGPRGILTSESDASWYYRSDVTVGMPGCRISMWVKPDPMAGRAYMGFGATALGAWSLVAAPNTGLFIIQQNSGYDFAPLVQVPQSYLSDSWYKIEVLFGDSGLVTGNLYGADGMTLLNSVSAIIPGLPQAGVAFRGFGFCLDSFESKSDMSSDWLRADRHSGSVPGGNSDNVLLTFDASNLDPGDYLAAIIINSNDPANQEVFVSARMLVNMGGTADLTLFHVDGLTMAGKLPYGQPVRFHIGLDNSTGAAIVGSTNGFQIYSPTGARWTTTTGMATGAIDSSMYDQGVFVSPFSIDGMGADTIGFGGFRLFGIGIPDGFNADVWTIDIGPIPLSYAGGTICLDSAFYRPAGIWKWSIGPAKTDYLPTWDGPHCFQIEDSAQQLCSLTVAPILLSFAANVGGPNPPCQSIFPISNCPYTMEFDTSWISVVMGEVGEFVCVDVAGLAPGHYHDSIHIWAVEDTSIRAAVAVDLMVRSDTTCGLSHFTNFVETGLSYPYVLSTPPACSLANGDEIGLFDVEQQLLVGALPYCGQSFPLNVNAWQSDSLHGLPGYIPGHHVEVRVYKRTADRVLCTDISGRCLRFNECTFGVIDSMNCGSCFTEFCMPIASNRWRTISLPVSPVNPATGQDLTCDVPQIFSPLNQLDILKDDHGGVYIPSFGINTIGCIDPCEGYDLFKFGQTEHLCVVGLALSPGCCTIQANRWNILGYPLLCPLPIDFVMQNILGSIDIVKDDDGRVFIPSFGVNTIGQMIPGKGYKIFLRGSSDRSLCFPGCFEPVSIPADESVPFSKPADERTRNFEFTVTGLAYPIVLTEIGEMLTMGDEIAVFDGDLCVGAIKYQLEKKLVLNAWKSDPEHNLPGYTPGKKFDIRLKSVDGGERSLLTSQDVVARFEDGPYAAINLAKTTALPKEYALAQNFPNPFNPSTVVQFALPEAAHVTLEIYNLLGRKVQTLIDDDYQAGNHEVVWSGDDSQGRAVSTGVYFYRLSANDFTQTKKMMLVK